MKKNITSLEQALQVLRGAGIKVDTKTRKQFWVYGKTYSEKVVNAGNFLDRYMIEDDSLRFKTEWINPNNTNKNVIFKEFK